MPSTLLLSLVVVVIGCLWAALGTDHYQSRFKTADSRAAFRERYGDWAIVAGASEGLGAAWADSLCKLGFHVLLVARREAALQTLAKGLMEKHNNVQVDYWVQDLGVENLDEVFQEKLAVASRKYGLLVYNAAYSQVGSFLEIPLSRHYTSINVNTRGVLQMTHVFGRILMDRKQTGGIVLMSSMSGEFGTAYVANYAATKAYDTALAQGLNHELARFGIDVSACVAGPITTPNYLTKIPDSGRNPLIEQTAEQVVQECLPAIGGRHSSIRTGIISKLTRFLLVRFLPLEVAMYIFNSESEKMIMAEQG